MEGHRNKRILLIADPSLGQLNVFLSTCHALLTLYPDVEVHVASGASGAAPVAETSDQALKSCAPSRSPIRFHALDAPTLLDVWTELPRDVLDNFAQRVSWRNLHAQPRRVMDMSSSWRGKQYVQIYREIGRVIGAVAPDVIAVDAVVPPALAAVRDSGVKWHVLTPLSMNSFYIGPELLWLPAPVSGLPFPLPWYLFPLNLAIMISFLIAIKSGSSQKAAAVHVRRELGVEPVTSFTDMLAKPIGGMKVLCPMLPEIEYPIKDLSDHLVACGPILRPVGDLASADAELATWLAEGPTILVNLGSHRIMDEEWAVEFAKALRIVFDAADVAAEKNGKPQLHELRVLWKLKKTGHSFLGAGKGLADYDTTSPGSKVHDVLGKEIDSGRVHMVSWLGAEPLAILQSGHVICSVHHGGANSSLETLASGVPHVVLPAWTDCYDWASRLEYLGVGRFGNKIHTPNWSASELGKAMVATVCGPEAPKMMEKAKGFADLINQAPPGREVAARHLLEGL